MVVSDKSALARACGAQGTWHQCGRPMTIATDTGSSFIATGSIERANDMAAAMESAPVKCAELRGTDERLFGTFGQMLMPRVPGHGFVTGDYSMSIEEFARERLQLGEWLAAGVDREGFCRFAVLVRPGDQSPEFDRTGRHDALRSLAFNTLDPAARAAFFRNMKQGGLSS